MKYRSPAHEKPHSYQFIGAGSTNQEDKPMKNRMCRPALTMIVLALTASQSLAQSNYEPYTFTTFTGLAGTQGSDDGTGSAARFNGPSGVAVDSAGNVYVADSGNSTIRKLTPAGVVTTLAGRALIQGSADETGSTARFDRAYGVAVDSLGNVYVADTWNATIRKVTPAGVVTTLAGLARSVGSEDGTGSAARFNWPYGVTVDNAGNVYVADTLNATIRKVTPTGVVTTLAGVAGSVGSADGTGSDARFGGRFVNSIAGAHGVAVDSTGNLYVADTLNATIRKVTPTGVVTTLAGLAGSQGTADGTGSAARFNSPKDVAVDSAGNVYVTGTSNHTIRKVTPTAVVTTLAGGGQGSADGTGSGARFYFPTGVAVDNVGNLYVADSFNNTIRKGHPALTILSSGPGFGLSGGEFGFNLTGPSGQSVVVEASSDLVSWLPLWTNTFTFPAALNFSDPQSGVYSNRFFRAHLP